jgi:hypothetical protein
VGFVNVFRFVVVSTGVVSDNYTLFLSEDVKLSSVDLEPNIYLALAKEKNFWKIVQLLNEYSICRFPPWLKLTQNGSHKNSVLLIHPTVIIVS